MDKKSHAAVALSVDLDALMGDLDALMGDEQVHKYIQRKTAKKNRCVAIKSTAAKLAKANYYMIRDQEPFDITKVL